MAFLILLVLLLFVGTGAVVKNVLAMTNETEHASPILGARLETEGVDHPDAVLSELVDDATQKSPSREGSWSPPLSFG